MAPRGTVVVVAARNDRVAQALMDRLEARYVPVVEYEPQNLSDVEVSLDIERFLVEGKRVSGLLWRVVPAAIFSTDFESSDQPFADAETVAVWLGALHAPHIGAINRYSASVWYGGCQWPVWRNLLRENGVSVSPIHFGCPPAIERLHWIPFAFCALRSVPDPVVAKAMGIATSSATPTSTGLLVDGDVLHPNPSPNLQAAAAALSSIGIGLARITVDERERVLFVDTMPDLEQADIQRISDRLVDTLCTFA
jgi:hypothetical protein